MPQPTTPPSPVRSAGLLRRLWRRWWVRAGLLLALAAGAWGVRSAIVPPPPPPVPPTGEAALADITQLVQAAGVLQPRLRVDVGAQVSGQVQKVHVQLGQQVRKGDVLISLDPALARSDVAQTEAELAYQAAQIDGLRASLNLARLEAERQQRLLRGEATAAAESDRAQAELARLEADLRGQSARLKRLQAELAQRELRLGYTTITAPIDGTVVHLPVQEGQTVSAVQSTPLMVTLADMDEITVRARVAEADIGDVRPGQKARFVTLAGRAQRHEGQVRVIQPVPERAGNAVFYNVLFEVPNRDRRLLSDMTVQVSIETARAGQVLSIPVVALGPRADDGRHTVHVLDARQQAVPRIVRTGLQDGTRVQVQEGLKPGDKVLLAPPPEPPAGAASAASAAAPA